MLSDAKVRKATIPEKTRRIADSHGLVIELRPNGRKVWRFRYRLNGKASIYTIGDFPSIGIAEARAVRDWARELVAQGKSPANATRESAPDSGRTKSEEPQRETLEAVGEEWIAAKRASWTPHYTRQVERALRRDVWPEIGHLLLDEVKPPDVLKVVKAIEGRGAPSVALLVKQWIGAIYSYAIVHLKTENDPSHPIRGAIAKGRPRSKAAFNLEQLHKLVRKLWACDGAPIGYRPTEIAVQLLALTFVRTVELRKAEWTQFDLDSETPLWRIPGENMKRGIPHVVPLPRQAVELLRELRTFTGNRKLCFPNMRRPASPISATTINVLLDRLGYGGVFSGHAFRTTASTLLNSYGWDADWIERQLSHTPSNRVRAAYNHAQYLPQRRAMLQWWADVLYALKQSEHGVPPLPPLPGTVHQARHQLPHEAIDGPIQPFHPEENRPR